MDTETIEHVRRSVRAAAERGGYALTELVVFGSRARADYREESDVDVLIVSPDFAGIPYYKRPKQFYREWPYDELPDPEFICLTPAEFDRTREKRPHIVRSAVEEGVSLV